LVTLTEHLIETISPKYYNYHLNYYYWILFSVD